MFPKTGRGCVPTTFMGATRDARASTVTNLRVLTGDSMHLFKVFGRGRPGGGGVLEVRFAHPVRLSPDTHSQGHGQPCLQNPATARACLAKGIPENGVSVKTSGLVWPGVRTKTFYAHVVFIFRLVVSGKRFSTHEKTENVTAETLTTPLLDFSQREEFSYSSF